ncbi:MAG: two-component regulator propeller domain-containing protein [Flavobacteriales bacterium]|nr:two-component regulator propeller domain-containing protein [Flavobacteriales bacterium]
MKFEQRTILSLLTSALAVVLCVSCIAQEYEVNFRQYRESDGISNEQIRSLLFSSDGYLYVGTSEGLNRFDGTEFFVWRHDHQDQMSIAGNVISDLFEDTQGRIWIATLDGGICRFDPRNQSFKRLFLPSRTDGQNISLTYCISIDDNNNVLVGSKFGVYQSANDGENFYFINQPRGGAIYDIENTSIALFVAGIGLGLAKIDAATVSSYPMELFRPLENLMIQKIIEDSENRIWLGTWDNHLHELLPDLSIISHNFTNASKIEMAGYEIKSLVEAEKNTLWIGMNNGEIWQFNTLTNTSQPLRTSKYVNSKLNGNAIYCMLKDPLNRIWIGTNAGLHLFDPSKLRFNITWLPNDASAVNQFIEFEKDLLVCTNTGMYKRSHINTELTKVKELKDLEAHSIYIAKSGDLYVGTNKSIYRFDKTKNQFLLPFKINDQFYLESVVSSRINAIGELSIRGNDFLVANTYGHGTVLINKKNLEIQLCYAGSPKLVENLINGIYSDEESNIWLLGTSRGLIKVQDITVDDVQWPDGEWDVEKWRHKRPYLIGQEFAQNGVSKNITGIMEDKPNCFWVTTRGDGLYYFNSLAEENFFESISYSPKSIDSIVKDKAGNLWMNSGGSLYCYQPLQKSWFQYGTDDGIPQSGLSGKLFVSEGGNVFVGGNGFFLEFNPADILNDQEKPQTRITHFKILDSFADSLLNSDQIILNSDQNFITFTVSSLCFRNPEAHTFQYLLEGFDNNWRNTGTGNYITFSQLPYGEYTLKVRTDSPGNAEPMETTSVKFAVLSPFYRQFWFISLITLVAIALIYFAIRYRIQQKKNLEEVRNKIARDLHDDIGSALGSISFYSQTAIKNIHSNNSENASMILEKMGATSREMIENMHDIVWAVNPSNDSPVELIERMNRFAKDICASNNIALAFDFSNFDLNQTFSMKVRKNVFLIFKESVYNSVKHSGLTKLKIRISSTGKKNNLLEVSDDGKGFDLNSPKHKGNGIRNISQRTHEIKGSFQLKSAIGNGTCLILQF